MESMDTSDPLEGGGDILRLQYQDWRKGQDRIIELSNIVRDDEGKASLFFSIASNQQFTLHCPTSYPDYQDDNFFVEADSSLHQWCNALNEFLLDSDCKLDLGAILSKGTSLYSSKDRTRRESEMEVGDEEPASEEDEEAVSEEEDDDDEEELGEQEDEQLDDMLDQDLNWELKVARRKKKWKAKENQIRSGETGEGGVGGSLGQVYHDSTLKNRQPKQVFTSAAASGILTNDLVLIMESKEETAVEADTVADNIFQWNVKMSEFPDSPLLQQDFEQLEAEFGYNYIELQLDFSMDLYPFFPPLVKVIRPRLQGSMMLRVTTMEILKLTYWDPARDMKSVLMDIKAFLSTWARLDLTSERNDRTRYPDGAYIDIEHHLLRLALVSEVTPRANKKYAVTAKPAVLPATAVESIGASSSSGSSGSSKKDTCVSLAAPGPSTTTMVTAVQNEPVPGIPGVPVGLGKKGKGWMPLPTSLFLKSGTDKKKKEEEVAKSQAKGTGYSSYSHKGWDIKAYQAAQKEKDKQIQLVLEKICSELKRLHSITTVQARNLPDLLVGATGQSSSIPAVEVVDRDNLDNLDNLELERRGGGRRKRKHSPEAAADGVEGGPVDPLSDLYAVLEGSALVPFLETKLQASSFLEIGRHSAVYRVILGIVREMSGQSCLVSLLGPLPDQSTSIHSLLQGMESQASIMIDRIGRASANGSVPKPEKAGHTSSTGKGSSLAEAQTGDSLAKEFLTLSKEVTLALKNTGFLPDINSGHNLVVNGLDSPESEGRGSPQAGPSSEVGMGEEPKSTAEDLAASLYCSTLSSLQFDSIEFDTSSKSCHSFQAEFDKAGTPSTQIIFRVAQEISSLAAPNSLPVSLASSILVRSDDEKSTLLKAVITGPEDTPYTGGVFEFDIYFPTKYPAVPPKVSFRTTGNGSVRFNPNLYNCGKVCLSLLGTWEGAQGEAWNAETSTIIQVLISIQSLILCPEPYYNEPGFERSYGTTQGNAESNRYNEEVFKNSLKFAILGQLSSPPEGFEEAVKAHFYLKRESLIKELETQMELYKSKEARKLVAEVKTELNKLERPACVKEG